jgi:hypothetical protein
VKAPTVFLPVELTSEGVTRARTDLQAIAGMVAGGGEPKEKMQRTLKGHREPDVVKLYEHARTVPNSRTPRLLELFAREDPLTPTEIGIALGNGKPLSKAQGRAIVRNLSRMEGHLLKQGVIGGRVLSKHFGKYETEGSGRYGLSKADRAALRGHLGI